MRQPSVDRVQRIANRQFGVISRNQILWLGFNSDWVNHRLEKKWLYVIYRGVYAVGRPELSRRGEWMAAVLACGDHAVLSHESAAALWEIRPDRRAAQIHIVVPGTALRRHSGIVVHRRTALTRSDITRRLGIPVTTPVCTLIDYAARHTRDEVESAINEADIRGLTNPNALRKALETAPPRPGVAAMRAMLDRRTFRLTRSTLERLMIPLAVRAGLPPPLTRAIVNGFEVDFYWPDLGLRG